jgi:hypothetical protein
MYSRNSDKSPRLAKEKRFYIWIDSTVMGSEVGHKCPPTEYRLSAMGELFMDHSLCSSRLVPRSKVGTTVTAGVFDVLEVVEQVGDTP